MAEHNIKFRLVSCTRLIQYMYMQDCLVPGRESNINIKCAGAGVLKKCSSTLTSFHGFDCYRLVVLLLRTSMMSWIMIHK